MRRRGRPHRHLEGNAQREEACERPVASTRSERLAYTQRGRENRQLHTRVVFKREHKVHRVTQIAMRLVEHEFNKRLAQLIARLAQTIAVVDEVQRARLEQ